MRRALAGGLAALVLALPGCGRIGPVKQPGPREAITYPRAYPKYTDLPGKPSALPKPPGPPAGTPTVEQLVPGLSPR